MNSFSLCLICRYLYLSFLRYNFAGYRFLSLCLLSCNTLNTLLQCSLNFFVMKNQGALIYDNSFLSHLYQNSVLLMERIWGSQPTSTSGLHTHTCTQVHAPTPTYMHTCALLYSHMHTHKHFSFFFMSGLLYTFESLSLLAFIVDWWKIFISSNLLIFSLSPLLPGLSLCTYCHTWCCPADIWGYINFLCFILFLLPRLKNHTAYSIVLFSPFWELFVCFNFQVQNLYLVLFPSHFYAFINILCLMRHYFLMVI